MNRLPIFANLLAWILMVCAASQLHAQEKQYCIRPKVLAVGVYDYGKVKKNPYQIYYDEEADEKFGELLLKDEKLRSSNTFGVYIDQENGPPVYFREESASEYCPELNYVIITGGHGYVSVYDLKTLEEISVNPSSYVYSPSGKYRFGTLKNDGIHYYIEVKENGKYVPYFLFYGSERNMSGVYWHDDETIHFLKAKERGDGSTYWIGYSTGFYVVREQ